MFQAIALTFAAFGRFHGHDVGRRAAEMVMGLGIVELFIMGICWRQLKRSQRPQDSQMNEYLSNVATHNDDETLLQQQSQNHKEDETSP